LSAVDKNAVMYANWLYLYVGAVCGYLSGARCKWFCIWSSWCHCHPVISCSSRIQNGLLFWGRLTHVVLEKRPLNRCSVVVLVVVQAHFINNGLWILILSWARTCKSVDMTEPLYKPGRSRWNVTCLSCINVVMNIGFTGSSDTSNYCSVVGTFPWLWWRQNHATLMLLLHFAAVSVMPPSGHFNVDNIRICKITVCYFYLMLCWCLLKLLLSSKL